MDFAPTFLENCRAAIKLASDAALRNVSQTSDGLPLFDSSGNYIKGRMPRGGPFGAALAVFDQSGAMELIGGPCVNAVMESGIASRHAEHETLSPEILGRLIARLQKAKEDRAPLLVVLFSSAQPCPTCQTKIEIIARYLIDQGFLAPDGFLVVYGLSYEATERLASFNDRHYACALHLAAEKPNDPEGLIRRRFCEEAELPPEARRFFSENPQEAKAAILQGEEIYATGADERDETDRFATAEVSALRNACLRYRKEGYQDSWTVSGTLYTPSLEMGPLLFSEATWTGVNEIVHVRNQQTPPAFQKRLRETECLSNTAFLRLLANGYGHKGCAVQTFRDRTCPDEAHRFWGELVGKGILKPYNSPFVLKETPAEKTLIDKRFTAPDIASFLPVKDSS